MQHAPQHLAPTINAVNVAFGNVHVTDLGQVTGGEIRNNRQEEQKMFKGEFKR